MKRERSIGSHSSVVFRQRWHYVAMGMFVSCWSTMLLPLLLFPTWAAARSLTLLLLSIGAVSVLTLLFSSFVQPPQASRRG